MLSGRQLQRRFDEAYDLADAARDADRCGDWTRRDHLIEQLELVARTLHGAVDDETIDNLFCLASDMDV